MGAWTVMAPRKTYVFLIGLLLGAASCAPKRTLVPRTVPDWDVVSRMGMEAPEELSSSQREAFVRGWSSLREDRLELALSELEGLSRRYSGSGRSARSAHSAKIPAIETAMGYVELRVGSADAAERRFQAALRADPAYGPAQSGYFLVALVEGDEERAFDRLKRLEQTYPQHELVERHSTTLRVNVAESRLRAGRDLVREQRYQEAAAAYLRALEVAPEAGALYLEAAEAELKAGFADRARVHAVRASELEPDNSDAHRVLGEASYASSDLAGAVAAFQAALALRPGDTALASRLDRVRVELRETTLPEEYGEIPESKRLTREQLAALVAIELRSAFDAVAVKTNVIATDISDSWANAYIRRAVGAGVLEVFPNHTFQPKAFVSRLELARALARALERLSPPVYDRAREDSRGRVLFSDLGRENVSYDAAAIAVSLRLLDPGDGGAFEPQKLVSGADGVAAVTALAEHVAP